MEFLTAQKRIVEDDLVFDIPYSRLRTMTENANPITIIEAPGPNEMVVPLSITYIPIATNETEFAQTTPGGIRLAYGDNVDDMAVLEEVGLGDPFTVGYYFATTRVSDGDLTSKTDAVNKAVKLFYNQEVADNGAEGFLRMIVTYKIIEVA